MAPKVCPVCLDKFEATAAVEHGAGGWGWRVDCQICGRFDIERSAWEEYLDPEHFIMPKLTLPDRARLAYRLRTATVRGPAGIPKLTADFVKAFIVDGCQGPTPGEQAINAIRLIGDHFNKTGERLESLPPHFFAEIGAPNRNAANELVIELMKEGTISANDASSKDGADVINATLTLKGWREYEEEKRGRLEGGFGFLAMKFNDPALDTFTRNVIKPCLKDQLVYRLIDMRGVPRAGMIDNIMREEIRNAKFVIVDLTHDNSGAYWESGYAEGLGKPVVYICEKAKFAALKTHFDTNHSTTVCWDAADPSSFQRELVSTLRRSLNLFPGRTA